MFSINKDNLHIENSYELRSRIAMRAVLYAAWPHQYGSNVWKRTTESLIREWRGHNLLYDLGLFRSRTKDVDLNYPSPWYMEAVWFILSLFYWGRNRKK